MPDRQANNPLHGITLEQRVERLVAYYGWGELGRRIDIRCFTIDPSVKSSLKFLRRTPWARAKVEALYVVCLQSADG
jgi:uncharacterized protein (DUF2132 family)